MNDLAIFEKQLQPLMPNFAQVLAGMMPVERMVRSLIGSLPLAVSVVLVTWRFSAKSGLLTAEYAHILRHRPDRRRKAA